MGALWPVLQTRSTPSMRGPSCLVTRKRLKIRYVANHYYIPVILSGEKEQIDYIKHIIQTPSEVKFLNELEDYLAKADNKFREFDWWMFSKIDESLDEVYIPWYDGSCQELCVRVCVRGAYRS